MPCSSTHMEPTAGERQETATLRGEFEALSDWLTHASDVLREYLLGNIEVKDAVPYVNRKAQDEFTELVLREIKLYVRLPDQTIRTASQLTERYEELNQWIVTGKKLTRVELNKVKRMQEAHRADDLKRLMKTFASTADTERMRKVIDADPTKPLAPQLGFDPDEF